MKVWNKLRPLWLVALFLMAWRAGAGSDDRSFSKVDRGMAQTMLKSTLGDIKNNYYDRKFHGVDIGARFAEASAVIDRATTFREAAQNGQIQQPGPIQQPQGTWQTPGSIQQPKGPWQKPGEIQKAGEIQSVKTDRCHQRLTVGADALFEFNKASLTDAAQQTLATLGPMIQKAGKHQVSVEGHTDSIGTAQYNQDPSEKRAKAVEDWLSAHSYIDPSTMQARGYGKMRPVAPNTNPDGSDNPDGRARNRRVEVVIDTCH